MIHYYCSTHTNMPYHQSGHEHLMAGAGAASQSRGVIQKILDRIFRTIKSHYKVTGAAYFRRISSNKGGACGTNLFLALHLSTLWKEYIYFLLSSMSWPFCLPGQSQNSLDSTWQNCSCFHNEQRLHTIFSSTSWET